MNCCKCESVLDKKVPYAFVKTNLSFQQVDLRRLTRARHSFRFYRTQEFSTQHALTQLGFAIGRANLGFFTHKRLRCFFFFFFFFLLLFFLCGEAQNIFYTQRENMYLRTYAPSEDSDQLSHPHSRGIVKEEYSVIILG